MHRSAVVFVREISDLADDCDFDAMTFLNTLAELQTSEPAEHVFDRIRQRIIHAVEREQEERHAARTKESINLAEYPDSFELASRIKRKFIALLGPTNSGKTHRAMEALMNAPSGVYLAPLRLLALENTWHGRALPLARDFQNVVMASQRDPVRLASGFLGITSVFGEDLSKNLRFRAAVIANAYTELAPGERTRPGGLEASAAEPQRGGGQRDGEASGVQPGDSQHAALVRRLPARAIHLRTRKDG